MTDHPAWLTEPALQQFFAAVQAAGGEARAVGGAVRDHLLGIEAQDVDLASTLPPEKIIEIAQAQGWKAIPTGIAHGTVTLVLPSRVIEVTTLRRDVETDGRHAVVAFTDRFEEDAARRDFTFNALYMDAQGAITDYFSGQADLAVHHVRFIGDATARIREDGLRILRYFRFLACYGNPPVEEATLAALAAEKEGLVPLSGERIAAEMQKLLSAQNPFYALATMAQIGLAPLLSAQAWNVQQGSVLRTIERQQTLPASPWVRLLCMIEPKQRTEAARWIGERWKLSRTERSELDYLAQKVDFPSPAILKEWLRHEARPLVEGRLLLAVVDQGIEQGAKSLFTLVRSWHAPTFEVTAKDLLLRGFTSGVALGDTLRAIEAQWVASDYRLDKEALLATVVVPPPE